MNNYQLEEIKLNLEDYLQRNGVDTTKPMFRCLICGSSDGCHLVPNTNRKVWKCFSANHSKYPKDTGDIFEYVQQLNNVDFQKAYEILKDMYLQGHIIETPKVRPLIKSNDREMEDFVTKQIPLDISLAIEHADENREYLLKRGISVETQKRYNIGFIKGYVHPKQIFEYNKGIRNKVYPTARVIIPTSDSSYLARAVNPQDEGENSNFKVLKAGETHIFNADILKENIGYCFCFEGEIDALSGIECGCNSIGLGSTSMIPKLFKEYTINKENVLIFALDNDQGGQETIPKAEEYCRKYGIPYIIADSKLLFNGAKDCNQALQNDRKVLTQNLEDYKNKAINLDKSKFKPIETQETPKWYSNLRYSNTGNLKNSVLNIETILNNDENYKNLIEFNEFTQKRIFNRENWTDVIESKIKIYLEKQYNIVVSIENINHACNSIQDEHRYHPIRDYLDSLVWDNKPRINTVFCEFLGSKNNIYTQAVASVTFLGAVARIYQPGIKYDTCTVFVGPQGLGKSKFISKLAVKEEWFTDSVSSFEGKEFYETIQGKWIVEIGEGTAFKKSLKETAKQKIASQQDTYRAPYARNTEDRKRQCIFMGTTNNYDFLKDETGDRRYYPIDVTTSKITKNIDNELTREYVSQLWAEAVYRYKQGEQIYITNPEVLKFAQMEQKAHFDESPIQSDIYNFLETPIPPLTDWYTRSIETRRRYIKAVQNGEDTYRTLSMVGSYKRDRISIKEIACELFGYELNQPIDRKFSLEISRTLTALGWNKSNKTERIAPYGVVKVFLKS